MPYRLVIVIALALLTALAGCIGLALAAPPPPTSTRSPAFLPHSPPKGALRAYALPTLRTPSKSRLEAFAPATPAIYGQVLAGEQPAPDQTLVLRRYLSAELDLAVLTTTTTITGAYAFANPPTPPDGWTYYVRYGPNTTQPAYVANWYGPDVIGYQAGETRSGGSLNIANVALLDPPDNAYVGFPATFRWSRRVTETDDYTWILYDDQAGGGWTSPPLGYVDAVEFEAPEDFEGLALGQTYRWTLQLQDMGEEFSIGYSFDQWRVFLVARKSSLYLPYMMRGR